jgi:hypothetical protein
MAYKANPTKTTMTIEVPAVEFPATLFSSFMSRATAPIAGTALLVGLAL